MNPSGVLTNINVTTPGSGYTAGVPYLRELLDNRLFWAIPERAGREPRGRTSGLR